MSFKTLDGSAPLIIGHRGIPSIYPENTCLSFSGAVLDHGADGIETDLRMSEDGVIYCFHDDDLRRLISAEKYHSLEASLSTNNNVVSIECLSSEQIRGLSIEFSAYNNAGVKLSKTLPIPSFSDVLKQYSELCRSTSNSELILYLEIKERSEYSMLLEILVRDISDALDTTQQKNIWLQSFDSKAMDMIAKDPAFHKCQKTLLIEKQLNEITSEQALLLFLENKIINSNIHNIHLSKTNLYLLEVINKIKIVEICHDKCVGVHAYTFRDNRYAHDYKKNKLVNSYFQGFSSAEEELRFFIEVGIDAILTDNTSSAKAALNSLL